MSSTYVPPVPGSDHAPYNNPPSTTNTQAIFPPPQNQQPIMYQPQQPLPFTPSKSIGEKVFGDSIGFVFLVLFMILLVVGLIVGYTSAIPNTSNSYGVVSLDGIYAGIILISISLAILIFYLLGTAINRVDYQLDIRKYIMIAAIVAIVLMFLIFSIPAGKVI
ncbi:MAG: hypothetical protein ACP5MW_06290 [Thermoplasmata archaeon]